MKLFNISKYGAKPVTALLVPEYNPTHYIIRHGITTDDSKQYELMLHPDHFKPYLLKPEITLDGIYGLGTMYNEAGNDKIDVIIKVDRLCTVSKVCIVLLNLTAPPGGYSTYISKGKVSQIYCPAANETHPTIMTYAPVLYVYGPCEINWSIFPANEKAEEKWKAIYEKSEWTVSKV